MVEPRISIVVPVYNTHEQYLKTCVRSILAQDYCNIELIIVDDGSTDPSTITILNALEIQYNHIIVYHKENGGVSSSRNKGTEIATGEYIMYVDADDIMYPDIVPYGVKMAKDNNADLVIGGVQKIATQQIYDARDSQPSLYKLEVDDYDMLRKVYFNQKPQELTKYCSKGYISRAPYARIIKSEIAKKTFFPIDLHIGEDAIWNLRLLNNAKNIYICNSVWYGYYIHDNSAIRKYYGNRERIVSQYLECIEKENKEFCNNNMDIYCNNIVMEFYCILRYELMAKECPMTKKEKNSYVDGLLKKEPWVLLTNHKNRKTLSLKHKLLLISCYLNIWQCEMSLLKFKNIINQN